MAHKLYVIESENQHWAVRDLEKSVVFYPTRSEAMEKTIIRANAEAQQGHIVNVLAGFDRSLRRFPGRASSGW